MQKDEGRSGMVWPFPSVLLYPIVTASTVTFTEAFLLVSRDFELYFLPSRMVYLLK